MPCWSSCRPALSFSPASLPISVSCSPPTRTCAGTRSSSPRTAWPPRRARGAEPSREPRVRRRPFTRRSLPPCVPRDMRKPEHAGLIRGHARSREARRAYSRIWSRDCHREALTASAPDLRSSSCSPSSFSPHRAATILTWGSGPGDACTGTASGRDRPARWRRHTRWPDSSQPPGRGLRPARHARSPPRG